MNSKKLFLRRHLAVAVAIAASVISPSLQANPIVPRYDVSGTWTAASGGTASYFQEGTEVIFINTDDGFNYYFVGRYVTPYVWTGIMHRRNKSNGCATEMLVTTTNRTAGYVTNTAKALDSNCDLIKGRDYTDTVTKVR